MQRRATNPTPATLTNFATTAAAASNKFDPMLRKSDVGSEPNDWRISVIEPKSGQTPMTVSEEPSSGKSPEIKLKKFVGLNPGSDMMISAIGKDKIGLPGQDSDGEFDAVIEESGMMDREDLKDL